MIRARIRWWFGDTLCRLGFHKKEAFWEHPTSPDSMMAHGGGDCERCGLGPL